MPAHFAPLLMDAAPLSGAELPTTVIGLIGFMLLGLFALATKLLTGWISTQRDTRTEANNHVRQHTDLSSTVAALAARLDALDRELYRLNGRIDGIEQREREVAAELRREAGHLRTLLVQALDDRPGSAAGGAASGPRPPRPGEPPT
jgi:outer membrane murein-binding lipoprotein Lpp